VVLKINMLHPENRTAVAFFFFNFRDSQKQDVLGMLRCLLRQLVAQLNDIPTSVSKFYGAFRKGLQEPSVPDVLRILQLVSNSFRRTYIFIDALDECKNRIRMLKFLDIIPKVKSGQDLPIHFIVSSRPYRDIETHLASRGFLSISLNSESIHQDIKTYLKRTLFEDEFFRRRDPALIEEIYNKLTDGSQGMYGRKSPRVKMCLVLTGFDGSRVRLTRFDAA
jgi:hypothetical protein